MSLPIDYVVTFVDGSDPLWRDLYRKRMHGAEPDSPRRYRDYGTLRYAFRGIEKFMPWINNVYLIVQQESQIPNWINRNCDKLKIVFHKDYIPKEFLPTFNSNVIELFINRIDGLSNQFILANDDMLPSNPLLPEDFFCNGQIVDNPKFKELSQSHGTSIFSYIKRNSLKLAAKAAQKDEYMYIENFHLLMPHIKQTWDEVWSLIEDDLLKAVKNSPKRTRNNVNHWLFRYFSIHTNRFCTSDNINNNGYVDISNMVSLVRAEYVINRCKMVCLNDHLSDKDIVARLDEIMQRHFPDKSSFEV